MAIDYNADILALYAADVAADANFQAPGNFGLHTGFGSRTLSSGVIAAAGSGYTTGQLLTLSGGTRTVAATLTVLTVSGGGAVLTFQVNNPGVYTVIPSNPISMTSGAFTLTGTWGGLASQRVMSFVSLMASYIAQADNAREVRLLQTVMARMMAEMRLGSPATWSAAGASTKALNAAMNYLAKSPAVPNAKDM